MPEHKKHTTRWGRDRQREYERAMVAAALDWHPLPDFKVTADRERFLTAASAKREAELLGQIKREEVKP